MKGRKGLAGVLVLVVFFLGMFLLKDVFAAENTVYVDLALIFDGYVKTKDFDAKLEQAQKAKQAEIDKKVTEIKDMQDKLSLLSEKEKANKQKQIDEKTRDLQEFQASAEKELVSDRNEKLKEILKDIQGVVEAVAKDKGYTLILDKRMLLYGSNNLDITDDILKRVNDSYKKK